MKSGEGGSGGMGEMGWGAAGLGRFSNNQLFKLFKTVIFKYQLL